MTPRWRDSALGARRTLSIEPSIDVHMTPRMLRSGLRPSELGMRLTVSGSYRGPNATLSDRLRGTNGSARRTVTGARRLSGSGA